MALIWVLTSGGSGLGKGMSSPSGKACLGRTIASSSLCVSCPDSGGLAWARVVTTVALANKAAPAKKAFAAI
ncbi:hypothetical protein ACI01nite_05870 [Acetobacter cibinongensis]|uniref:Uncharacterized protein n=1 Tax=Acetobacter cibinongensis TaxID=146475 RepID=A0A0D6N447_9PROT|nr:hypothetical protein Abci_011_011 [Acetobacter cibinongensis]GEL57985.1 hypothetical protein ACI01nite_05870 [Acetobacter cibinongensis]